MTKFSLVSKKLGLMTLFFSVLLVAESFSYGEAIRQPAAGEKVVTFDVTKMT